MSAPQQPLAAVLADLVAVGKKLVETSESCLALLERGEAECLSSGREPVAEPPMSIERTMLMTADEVARELRLGRRTLGRLRADPEAKFPQPLKRAKALRWRRGDVARYRLRSS